MESGKRLSVLDVDPDYVCRFLLNLLVTEQPARLSLDELVSRFAGTQLPEDEARILIQDGLVELTGYGLAHVSDGFAFASRAAVHMSRLHEP